MRKFEQKFRVSAKLNIAVFASGRGSNFRAIVDAIKNGSIPHAKIVVVISNNSDAGALQIAKENGITGLHLSRKQFSSDESFTTELLQTLRSHRTNLIVLAGYMKKIDPTIIRAFRKRIINVHPALLPSFGGTGMYGLRVHEAVIASKATVTGATVHVVDEEYDHGQILLQKEVPVEPDDTPESLAARVLKVEHEIYPQAIRLIAEGQITLDGHQPEDFNSR